MQLLTVFQPRTAYRVSTATPTKVRIKCAGQLSQGSCLTKDLLSVISLRSVPGDGLKSLRSLGAEELHTSATCHAQHCIGDRVWSCSGCMVPSTSGGSQLAPMRTRGRALHARYTPATRPLYVCTACVVSVGTRLPHSVGTRLPLWLPLGCHSVGTRFVKNPLTRYRRSEARLWSRL